MHFFLYTAFGSESFLNKLNRPIDGHNLSLLESNQTINKFQLIDFSRNPSIFKSPQKYEVLNILTDIYKSKFYVFDFLVLNRDNQKVFDKKFDSIMKNKNLPQALDNAILLHPLKSRPYNRMVLRIVNSLDILTKDGSSLNDLISSSMGKDYFQTIYHLSS